MCSGSDTEGVEGQKVDGAVLMGFGFGFGFGDGPHQMTKETNCFFPLQPHVNHTFTLPVQLPAPLHTHHTHSTFLQHNAAILQYTRHAFFVYC